MGVAAASHRPPGSTVNPSLYNNPLWKVDMTKNVLSALWPKPADNRIGKVFVDLINLQFNVIMQYLLSLNRHNARLVKKKTIVALTIGKLKA